MKFLRYCQELEVPKDEGFVDSSSSKAKTLILFLFKDRRSGILIGSLSSFMPSYGSNTKGTVRDGCLFLTEFFLLTNPIPKNMLDT